MHTYTYVHAYTQLYKYRGNNLTNNFYKFTQLQAVPTVIFWLSQIKWNIEFIKTAIEIQFFHSIRFHFAFKMFVVS